MESTQRPGNLARGIVALLILIGSGMMLANVVVDSTTAFVVGSLMAGIGFVAIGLGHFARQSWVRSQPGEYLPRWAAAILVIGGIAFLAGAVMVSYL